MGQACYISFWLDVPFYCKADRLINPDAPMERSNRGPRGLATASDLVLGL